MIFCVEFLLRPHSLVNAALEVMRWSNYKTYYINTLPANSPILVNPAAQFVLAGWGQALEILHLLPAEGRCSEREPEDLKATEQNRANVEMV